MKLHKNRSSRWLLRSIALVVFAILWPASSIAQKTPTEFKSRLDDKQLCGNRAQLTATEYCDFWKDYNTKRKSTDQTSQAQAKDSRNELIKYVRGHVDRFYEESTAKKKFNRNLLQSILDVLEVGAAVAIGITNGERAKEVIGIALGGLQAGRTALNRNFDLLQTRVLINKMREDRAQILTRIVDNMRKPVSEYSWLDAKNDLRDYLYAGTFSNALDSLVAETGEEAENAEKTLRMVSNDIVIVPEATRSELNVAQEAQAFLETLEKDLTSTQTVASLKNILAELQKEPELRQRTDALGLSETSEGPALLTGIIQLRRQAVLDGRVDLASLINKKIVAVKNVR